MARYILLVEEDWFLRDMVAAILREQGWETKVACSCAEAGAIAAEASPCLFLVDARLPDGDGLSLLKRLREVTEGQEVPAVLLSATPVLLKALGGYQVQKLLQKPFSVAQLLTVVRVFLSEAPQQDAR